MLMEGAACVPPCPELSPKLASLGVTRTRAVSHMPALPAVVQEHEGLSWGCVGARGFGVPVVKEGTQERTGTVSTAAQSHHWSRQTLQPLSSWTPTLVEKGQLYEQIPQSSCIPVPVFSLSAC